MTREDHIRRASALIAEAIALLTPAQEMTAPLPSHARLLTVGQVCERWSCEDTLVRRLVSQGALLKVVLGERGLRIPLASVEAYEHRQTRGRGSRKSASGTAAAVESEVVSLPLADSPGTRRLEVGT